MKYREFSDGLISFNKYEYDEKNNLVKETFERSDSVTGQTFYHYNQQGLLEKADCQGLNGWFYGIIDYEYSEDKKEGAAIFSEGEKIGIITYSYEGSGNLLSETWEFKNGWSQQFIYEYANLNESLSFASSNVFINNTTEFRVTREEYDFSSETGGPSFYEYGKDGRLVKKVFERSDTFRTETTYEYTGNGILKHSFRSYSNELTAEFSYSFDGNRRLTNRSFTRSDGISGSEKYIYNEKGWLVTGLYKNFDSWLTGSIQFKHDENGLISEGYFQSKDGYEANISFSHDIYGNVTRIHWEFSFGKTQTYYFKYEKVRQR